MNILRRESQPAQTPPALAERDPYRVMREFMRWDPFREIGPSLFRDRADALFVPDVDVQETQDAYVFKADLPGLQEKDVEVSMTGNRLTLSGRREEERKEEKANYFVSERSYGSFSRSFTLPTGTDLEHIAADLEDGVLTVRVPKKPEVQPKKIAVGTEKTKS